MKDTEEKIILQISVVFCELTTNYLKGNLENNLTYNSTKNNKVLSNKLNYTNEKYKTISWTLQNDELRKTQISEKHSNLWIGRLHTVEKFILLKMIYGFSTILAKWDPNSILTRNRRSSSQFIWNYKRSRIVATILRGEKKQSWKPYTFWLQIYSNRNNMALE